MSRKIDVFKRRKAETDKLSDIISAYDEYKFKFHDSTFPEIYFLGTNGWYDTNTGNTICTLIKHTDYSIIIDAGFGIYKIERYIDFKKPVYLFISHLHIDHICGLHLLSKFNFEKELKILVKRGLKVKLNRFLSSDYTIPLSKLSYKACIFEIDKDKIELPFGFNSLPLKHSVPTLGFRFEVAKKIISVISDTGYCENALKLAEKSDLLITECAYLTGEYNEDWPHLNPDLAKKIKEESNSKYLVLTHFAADKYLTQEDRRIKIW